jgi:hypothetical protein
MTDQPVQVPLDLDNVIEVNPNALHGSDPAIYVALIRDVQRVPVAGQMVTVIQPDDDPNEPRYISIAHVIDIDESRGLIVLNVDWEGFHDAPADPVSAAFQRLRDHIVSNRQYNLVVDASTFVVNAAPATSAIVSSHTESSDVSDVMRLATAR